MAVFDRSQFKKKQNAFDDSAIAGYTNTGQRIGYHTIEPGNNWHRFYPDPKGGPFLSPKVVAWLPQEKEEEDAKTHKKKKSITRLPILNSKVHHTWAKGEEKMDLVEEYIAFLRKMLEEEIPNEEERKERMFPIEGDAKSYLTSIKPKASWIAYTDFYKKDSVEFGRIEIGSAVKSGMKVLEEGQESGPEDVLDGICIFSDPDEGKKVNILSKPNEKNPNDKYNVILGSKATPIDDATLEEHSKRESLSATLKFKASDFYKQIAGLKLFDDEHGYGVFADDRFLDILEKMSKYFPDEEAEKSDESDEPAPKSQTIKKTNPPAKSATKINKRVDEDAEEGLDEESVDDDQAGDEFDGMDRTALKIYNRDQKLGVFVTGKISDDDIRKAIRQAIKAQQSDIPEEKIVEEKPAAKKEEAPKQVKTTVSKSDAKARIDEIKAKTAKKTSKEG